MCNSTADQHFLFLYLDLVKFCCSMPYAAITLKIQSADGILVFLSADKHHFVGRLKLLH